MQSEGCFLQQPDKPFHPFVNNIIYACVALVGAFIIREAD